jgi:hypothetical protein
MPAVAYVASRASQIGRVKGDRTRKKILAGPPGLTIGHAVVDLVSVNINTFRIVGLTALRRLLSRRPRLEGSCSDGKVEVIIGY